MDNTVRFNFTSEKHETPAADSVGRNRFYAANDSGYQGSFDEYLDGVSTSRILCEDETLAREAISFYNLTLRKGDVERTFSGVIN